MTSLPSPSFFSFCARCCLTFSHNFIHFFAASLSTFPFGAHFCCDSLGSHKWAKKNFMTLRILSLCVDSSQCFFFVQHYMYSDDDDGPMEHEKLLWLRQLLLCLFLSFSSAFLYIGEITLHKKKAQKHTAESSKDCEISTDEIKAAAAGRLRNGRERREAEVDNFSAMIRERFRAQRRRTWKGSRDADLCGGCFVFAVRPSCDAVRWRNFFH